MQVDGEQVVRRTGYHLVPFLFVTALLTYLDRGALSFAAPSLNTVLACATRAAPRALATCPVFCRVVHCLPVLERANLLTA